MSRSITSTTKELLSSVENSLDELKARLNFFADAFKKEFSPEKPDVQGGAEALAWALMSTPLLLYGLGLNGPAITELHSVLEKFTLRETGFQLGIPSKTFEHHSLYDLSVVLQELGLFDKEDVKFTRKLTELRNSLAHRNERKLSNALFSGREIDFLNIESEMRRYDPVPTVLASIHFMLKLFYAHQQKRKVTDLP